MAGDPIYPLAVAFAAVVIVFMVVAYGSLWLFECRDSP